jgi:hypothetical protein
MPTCDCCGNDYDKTFDILRDGQRYTFDSFECAIQKLAPTCNHCGCRIIGHGVEGKQGMFCCASCARHEGQRGLSGRASAAQT